MPGDERSAGGPVLRRIAAHLTTGCYTVDVRYLDHQVDGTRVYCISILENYSRAMLASAISRTQDLTAYLIVLFAAIQEHGSPDGLVSDGGAVFRAKQAMEIYRRLGITKFQIEKRQAWQSYIETAFSVQRRMADDEFLAAGTWEELQTVHDRWFAKYNYQMHWAHRLRDDGRESPAEVLDWVKGDAKSGHGYHMRSRRSGRYRTSTVVRLRAC